MTWLARRTTPVTLTVVALILYMGFHLVRSGFDPYVFVRIGSAFDSEHAVDESGYDGQFVYFIARDPNPAVAAGYLDVPAYRYQRILLPLFARLLSFGNEAALPWVLVLLGIAAHAAGVAVVERLLVGLGVSRWYALIYGLWAGLLLAARLDLPEPLAYALVAAAVLVGDERPWMNAVFFGLAVFAKEVALLFAAGQLLFYLQRRDWRGVFSLAVLVFIPFAIFQLWLLRTFGAPGIGSGGAMATGFEIIPFMGWFRIFPFSPAFFFAYGMIVIPFFYLPALWALRKTVQALRKISANGAYLLTNAAVIPFLPFSTVREPGGLFRFGCGLMLAFLLFAAESGEKKVLRYALAWLALSTVVLNA